MVDQYDGPFAGVVTPAGICVQTSQDNIITEINKVKALFSDAGPGTEGSETVPDFDQIPFHTAEKFRAELDALITAVDAMAIA